MALADIYVRRLDGHDGSHYQPDAGPVDMAVLRAALWWLGWKASQSTKYVDPSFVGIRAEAHRVGFPYFLPYHWLSSTTDPIAQADHYLSVVGKWLPGEGAMLDAEENGIDVLLAGARRGGDETAERRLLWPLRRWRNHLARPPHPQLEVRPTRDAPRRLHLPGVADTADDRAGGRSLADALLAVVEQRSGPRHHRAR
jgi:hypothetical protein